MYPLLLFATILHVSMAKQASREDPFSYLFDACSLEDVVFVIVVRIVKSNYELLCPSQPWCNIAFARQTHYKWWIYAKQMAESRTHVVDKPFFMDIAW
jgi:hypothetical protein